MRRIKILITLGTRPEVVKLAPLITAFRARDDVDVVVVATAQHRDLLDAMLHCFSIEVDRDLNLMRPEQSLTDVVSRMLPALGDVIATEQPDYVIAQGDTSTVFATALASRYQGVPMAHVEAGLRTGDLAAPFPEEIHRRLVADLATLHFAPTERAKRDLLAEGIALRDIEVTGNTIVDAVQAAMPQVGDCPYLLPDRSLILCTMHRRESFGAAMDSVCDALIEIVAAHPVDIVFPVHPNPKVAACVQSRLAGHEGIHLCEPLGYLDFLAAVRASCLILTDSGGVQEEAPSFGVPVLVLRAATERPEALEAGIARLVGTDSRRIFAAVDELLVDPVAYRAMTAATNPFGDGHAAERIVAAILQRIRALV